MAVRLGIVASAGLAALGGQAVRDAPGGDARAARVDAIFAPYDTTRTPGCAVGVIKEGRFLLKRGYGMASLEHGVLITPATVFRVGSTSKQFTAATILLLEQAGTLSLDDDVRGYLPELPDFGVPVTIRHLLHHTSGYRDYLELMTLAGKRQLDYYTDAEVVALLARQRRLNFPPGEEHLYSNSGYFLLSQIVRRVTGRPLREVARERIFAPLGMVHTHFHDDPRHTVANRAWGYSPREGGGFRLHVTTLPQVGDGGLFTSVEDLLLWDRNLYDAAVGGERFPERMLEVGVLNSGERLRYALGLVRGSYRGLETVSHAGAFVGYRAEMVRFPAERFTVICLCNRSDAEPARLARAVAEVYLGDRMGPPGADGDAEGEGAAREEAVPGAPPELNAQQLGAYVGRYASDELGVTYEIVPGGDGLELRVGNELDGPLRPVGPDLFRRRHLRLRFERDAAGQVAGFVLETRRVRNLAFVRLAGEPVAGSGRGARRGR